MIFHKPRLPKLALLSLLSLIISFNTYAQAGDAAKGKQLFSANCASCHNLDKRVTGPALRGFKERGPWADQKEVHKWVQNPSAYMASNAYAKGLQQEYQAIMTSFAGQLTDKDIDDITEYIVKAPPPVDPSKNPVAGGSGGGSDSENGGLLFGIISIVLAIVALILMQVNNNLKKLSDDKEGISRPEQVPFWRNKVYIAILSLVVFMIGGYFVAKSAIGLGRQQGYQPDQPIYYSHKVHAGVNQINCLYCHGSAMESKHAGIPSLNVCMNCHKAISSYEKGPKLFDEEGKEINGTAQIQKLYQYAGFTPGKPWDPAKATSPKWVKIHNLPDHVYFNHAQHVKAGNVQCQQCHGNIQEMDKVKQVAELSMGWCINCHRETKVNFYNKADSTGNKFYSIYEKFHNDIKAGKMDSVRVQDIGGLECQKCHY